MILDREAVACQANRRGRHHRQRHGPKATQRFDRTRQLARGRNREPALGTQSGYHRTVANEQVAVRRRGSGLAKVERVGPTARAFEKNHEAAAADPTRGRIGDSDRQRRRHRGVDGVAAVAQDLDPGSRRQAVFGCDDGAVGPQRGGRQAGDHERAEREQRANHPRVHRIFLSARTGRGTRLLLNSTPGM